MILRFTILFLLTKICISQKPSPCPEIFSYEHSEDASSRWFGILKLSSKKILTGVWLHIALDNQADLLGNWFGQAATVDNTIFVIRNSKYIFPDNFPKTLRFFVNFNPTKPIPSIETIKFNGNIICTSQKNQRFNDTVTENRPKDSTLNISSNATTSNNLVTRPTCGIVASRVTPLIFRGLHTSPGQWPWHAALYHFNYIQKNYACGATLITDQHVITAAHCVCMHASKTLLDMDIIEISLGKYDLNMFEKELQDQGVSNITIHPKYDPVRYYNDIAILKLTKPAQITDFVRPCCLWDDNPNLDSIVGKNGVVVGWGYTENRALSHKLMQAEMPVVSFRECISSGNGKDFRKLLSENSYCAGYRNGTSLCRGDSGGAMVFPKSEEDGQTVWHIRGIVSTSLAANIQTICETSNYNIFTDVAKYMRWIKEVIKQ